MKILGIEIEKKTDILAMAAFLISVGSIIGQIALLLRGAEVALDGPRQVILFFESTLGPRRFLNAISTQIYVNNGSPNYDDILKSETLSITAAGKTIQLESQDAVDSTRDSNRLKFRSRQAWKPAKIKAGDFISNETLFVPYPSIKDQSRDADFIDKANFDQLLSTSREVQVVLIAKTYGGQELTSTCFLNVPDIRLGMSEKGWASLKCDSKSRSFMHFIKKGLGLFLH